MSGNLNSSSPELDRAYPFLSQMAEIRSRARRHIQDGAAGEPEVGTVLRLLNEALATELVCVARYRRRAAMSGGTPDALGEEFLKYAQEEQGHADQLTSRIRQLGGEPEPLPLRDSAELQGFDADALADLLEEDLIAERIAIDSYREMAAYIGSSDATTRQLLECILRVEMAHVEELCTRRNEALRRERVLSGATSPRLPALELH